MKRPVVTITLISTVLLGLPALGQMTAEENRAAPAQGAARQPSEATKPHAADKDKEKAAKSADKAAAHRKARTSQLLGVAVKNPQGEDLGELTEVVVEPQTGDVKYGVLRSGGVMGVGGNNHAIPINSFQLREDGSHLVLNITQDQLKEAQGFEGDNWPDGPNMALADPDLSADAMGGKPDEQANEAVEQRELNLPDEGMGAADANRVAENEDRPAAANRQAEGPSGDLARQGDDQLRQQQQKLRDEALAKNSKIVPLDREHLWTHKVSDLMGTDVRSGEDEIGEISDLVITLSKAKLSYAVLSYGGTLGVGDKKVIVPWHAIDLNKEDQIAVISVDRATLDQLAFEGDAMPDMNDEQWIERTRRAFGEDPRGEVFGYPGEADKADQKMQQPDKTQPDQKEGEGPRPNQ